MEKLNDLLKELKRTTDKNRYTEIMAEIESIKLEHQLAENALLLDKEEGRRRTEIIPAGTRSASS